MNQVKEDFPDLVKKCFVTDCPPGKGYEKTDAGAEHTMLIPPCLPAPHSAAYSTDSIAHRPAILLNDNR